MDLLKTRAEIIRLAQSKLGHPYLFGATGPDEFDCEGLWDWIMRELGRPNYTQGSTAQFDALPKLKTLEPGCAVYFYGEGATHPAHVGVFVGMESTGVGRMISALDTEAGICYSSFSTTIDQESHEGLAYWGTNDPASLVASPADPVPYPPSDPQPLPSPHPTGKTWPQIDAFLAECGPGELEYIYKSLKPLFEKEETPLNETPTPVTPFADDTWCGARHLDKRVPEALGQPPVHEGTPLETGEVTA